jgi:DNA-binding response OmpR family regulator
MIILVSDNPGQIEALCTQFKQKGYLYSVVPDETKAVAAASADHTSLLLIDTTGTSFDGFGLCKTIRTDETLRGLPVLLLTSLGDVSVLLKVLDCMADAFITTPFEPQSLLSTIDDLLKAHEGKKPSSAVRTRFVVTDENRNYSVVADRRQLLEFLLSTFELAVRIRGEQEQTKHEMLGKLRGLSERLSAITSERDTTVRNHHNELEERNRTITRLTTALEEKELEESLLHTQSENFLQNLKKKDAVIEEHQRLLLEKSVRVAALEGQVAALAEEKERADRDMHHQMDELNAGIERQKSDLATATKALEQEQQVRASTEAELADLRTRYASAQQYLDSASRDIGVLNTALSEEKEKQRKVEERLNAVIQESGDKDRAIQALRDDRTALKNELDEKKTTPSASDEKSPAPSQGIMNSESVPQRSGTTPPFALAEEHEQKEPEPLLPLPQAAQMKLPQPAPSVPLPEEPTQEPDVPVAEPQYRKSPPEKEGKDTVVDTNRAMKNQSAGPPGDWTVNRNLWFDMIKWVHHTDAISPDQRKELLDSLMKTSRLVQQGRHLTCRQEEIMRTLLVHLQALGYRFH